MLEGRYVTIGAREGGYLDGFFGLLLGWGATAGCGELSLWIGLIDGAITTTVTGTGTSVEMLLSITGTDPGVETVDEIRSEQIF